MVTARFRAIAAARPSRAACILSLLAALPILAAIFWVKPSFAADQATAPVASSAVSAPPAAASVPLAKEVKPTWAELTPAQRDVLGPLAGQWPQLDSNHKVKWLAISNKYPSMTPEQQGRLKQNIADWAKLTPEQHRLARESYAKAKKLDPEQKSAQWQQYQQLPEEQKRKLAADAAAKKRIANVPSLQSKAKTVEPLRQPKKPASSSAPAANAPSAASVPAPGAPVPSAAPVPATNSQPATPAGAVPATDK
jgi:hypothetical protein